MMKTLSQYKNTYLSLLVLYFSIFCRDRAVFCRDRVHLLIFSLLCCDKGRTVMIKFLFHFALITVVIELRVS